MVHHTTLCKSITNAWDVAKIKPFKIINWPFAFYFNSHLNIINFGLSSVAWNLACKWNVWCAHTSWSVFHTQNTYCNLLQLCVWPEIYLGERRRKVCNLNWISCNLLAHHWSNILYKRQINGNKYKNYNTLSVYKNQFNFTPTQAEWTSQKSVDVWSCIRSFKIIESE